MSRDNFSDLTKSSLARNVHFRCVYPGCPLATHGPKLIGEGEVNIGNAAHITAAAKNGPRFDPEITPEQRKSYANGAWLCAGHASLIDKDENSYPPEMLRQWQHAGEQRARDALHGVSLEITTTQVEVSRALSQFIPQARRCINFNLPRWPEFGFELQREYVSRMEFLIRECSGYNWHPGHTLNSGHPTTVGIQDRFISGLQKIVREVKSKERWFETQYSYSIILAVGTRVTPEEKRRIDLAYQTVRDEANDCSASLDYLSDYMQGKRQ